MIRLTLYGTAGCHLCEEAETLVRQCLAANGRNASLRTEEIADAPALLERYGLLIPVLREEASGTELHWPFGTEDILRIS